MDMRPKTEGIMESSLYVTDVARSAQFYAKIFGFWAISDFGASGCPAMEAGNRQVLLLFKKRASRAIQ
jgi:predicted enzyme related to lactoylglutathione lyase